MKKMSQYRAWLFGAAGLALVLYGADPASARNLLGSDFSKGSGTVQRDGGTDVDYRAGLGWKATGGGDSDESKGFIRVDLKQAGVRAEEGTLDFTLQRAEQSDTEALFTLFDQEGVPFAGALIFWKGHVLGSQPELVAPSLGWTTFREADPRGFPAIDVSAVVLPISPGAVARLTFTWSGEGDFIYLDGRRIAASTDRKKSFGAIMAQSSVMYVGTTVTTAPSYYNDQMTSVVRNVAIHDVATLEVASSARAEIQSISNDAKRVAGFSGKLVAGNRLGVTLHGTPGVAGTFDLVHYPDVGSTIEVDWGGWGVYPEKKIFFDPGEVDLRDVEGYEVYASKAPFNPLAPGIEPLAILGVQERKYAIETPDVDQPYYVAVVAQMRDGSRTAVISPIANKPLAETAPGIYEGSYTVGWLDRYPRAAVVGRLVSGVASAEMTDSDTLETDPSLTIVVGTEPKELKADEKSVARVEVVVTDANGNAVPEHEVKFMLFTTSQYTGVVGGGAFKEQVGGSVKASSFGKTDLFGRVSASYIAGFAAKTAIVVARDLLSNSTGAGYVKTYISATAQLELLPVEATAAMDQGYAITVTSSDKWLTADGKSTARITALVTMNGQPVEGHRVGFSVASGAGSIRAVQSTTDRSGRARAVYTAGKKIGMVLVTAADTTANISGSVQIELRSDAPAKIAITIDPDKLPADGRSRTDLKVLVTDINDNPNDGVEVEYDVTEGSGSIREKKNLTDRFGESETEYVAGRTPGRVSIEITVRSTVPTEEEMSQVQDAALAVTDYDFF